MTGLIRAELLKLRTTRDLLWSTAATLLIVLAAIALTITSPSPGASPLDSGAGVRSVVSAASSGSVLMLLVGITAVAGEFRHGTVTATFLVAPDRGRVVAAKLVATMLAGLVVTAAAAALTLAVGLPWLAAEEVDLAAHAGDVVLALLGSAAATVVAGAIGVGLGALLRNQTTAVVLALVWAVVVESLVVGFVPELFRWLPGGAAAAMTGMPTTGETFGLAGGVALSLGYALAFAATGRSVLRHRDIA